MSSFFLRKIVLHVYIMTAEISNFAFVLGDECNWITPPISQLHPTLRIDMDTSRNLLDRVTEMSPYFQSMLEVWTFENI